MSGKTFQSGQATHYGAFGDRDGRDSRENSNA